MGKVASWLLERMEAPDHTSSVVVSLRLLGVLEQCKSVFHEFLSVPEFTVNF